MISGFKHSSLLWSISGAVGKGKIELDVESSDGSKFIANQLPSKNDAEIILCFAADAGSAPVEKSKASQARELEWGDFTILVDSANPEYCLIRITPISKGIISLAEALPGKVSVAANS